MLAARNSARSLHALSLLSLIAALSDVHAQSCPRRSTSIEAVALTRMPDVRSSTSSQPDSSVLFSGEDILFHASCDSRLCGWHEVRVTLADESGAMLVSRFEPVLPGKLWKVHPEQPLAPGAYRLSYRANIGDDVIDDRTYLFSVEAERSAGAPTISATQWAKPERRSAGEGYACSDGTTTDCGAPKLAYTHKAQYTSVDFAVEEPISVALKNAYVARLLPSNLDNAAQVVPWVPLDAIGAAAPILDAREPVACFVTQIMRVSDGTITSNPERCLRFVPEPVLDDPKPLERCDMLKPTAYVQAWCQDNLYACAPDKPRAGVPEVKEACAPYADVCAPWLGRRAEPEAMCH